MFQGRGADGVAVIAAYEHDRAGTGGGDVEGGVEIAFRGGAFAEVAGCYSSGEGGVEETLEFQGVGGAGGLGDLGGEGGGDCELDGQG